MVTKLKAESYNNFKGINNKVSEYNNTQYEVRDLQNLSFQHPGAWDSRPGTTTFFGVTTSVTTLTGISLAGEITGLYEYTRIIPNPTTAVRIDFKMISNAWNNAVSASLSGGLYTYDPVGDTLDLVLADIEPSAGSPLPMDFVTFVDYLFGCNSHRIFKYNGVSPTSFTLPNNGYSNLVYGPGTTAVSGFTGTVVYSFCYFNERGFVGAPGGVDTAGGGSPEGTWPNEGLTGLAIVFGGFTIPSGYGISGIAVFRTDLFGGQTAPRYEIARFSGATFVDYGFTISAQLEPTCLWFTLVPKYMELFNNSLALIGFSSLPSTVYLSDVGEPESIQPESFFEVRTNDGDQLTGAKAYNGELLLFKRKSFHKLLGDSPETYALVEISTEYGCLSNRAIVEFEGVIWFLDERGIVEFNGAVPKIVSSKVEDIFDNMAIDYAFQTACAVHVKSRREVWFAIPSKDTFKTYPGSDTARYINDTIVVYDYFSDAWTTFKGVFPTILSEMKAYIPEELPNGNTAIIDDLRVYAGSYTGGVYYFDASLTADYTGAFTCLAQSRFLADLGNSVTKEFRRFYLDVTPQGGATQVFGIQMYTDYSTSASLSRSMPITPFQSRMDFGLPAKSLSVEISYSNASLPVQINGHTIEYRELRRV